MWIHSKTRTRHDKNIQLFVVMIASKIYKIFDFSHKFLDIFGVRNKNKQENLGYYEIENIDNPCLLKMAINPKEY